MSFQAESFFLELSHLGLELSQILSENPICVSKDKFPLYKAWLVKAEGLRGCRFHQRTMANAQASISLT
jgi:hypothetical protein